MCSYEIITCCQTAKFCFLYFVLLACSAVSSWFSLETNVNVASHSREAANTISKTSCQNLGQIDETNLTKIAYKTMTSNIKPTAEYDLIDEKPVVASNNYFLLHINISSLHAHLDELKELLLAIKIMPALILICETRIRNKPLLNVNIDGYSLMHKPSPTQAGGVGIPVYVRNDIRVKRNDDFNLNLEGCEDLWIDVELNCSKNHYLFGVIYRHPNSKVNNFLQELNTKLSLITQKNKKCIIMGDININLLEKSGQTVDYLLKLQSSSFFSVLNKPTQITPTSKTLIDHILTNDVNLTVKPCIIIHKIADHLPIACVISDEQFKNVGLQVKKIICKSDIKNLNLETFA